MVGSFSRRGLLVGGGGALIAAAGLSFTPASADPAQPLPTIDGGFAALESRYDAYVGVFAVGLDSGRVVSNRADDPFAMCSTFKVYAAARVLQKAHSGELDLSDAVTIESSDIVANSPVTMTRVGRQMTLAELCEAALQRSDNAAGNWLLRTIGGPPAVNDFARSVGDDRTRLDRWETDLNSALPDDPRDTSTPHALGTGFQRLLTGDVLASAQRERLVQWMLGNQTSSMRAGLPSRWTSADKTGSGDYGSTNDVGVVYGPDGQRAVLAIMTRSQANDPKAADLRPLIAEVATLVLPYLTAAN